MFVKQRSSLVLVCRQIASRLLTFELEITKMYFT